MIVINLFPVQRNIWKKIFIISCCLLFVVFLLHIFVIIANQILTEKLIHLQTCIDLEGHANAVFLFEDISKNDISFVQKKMNNLDKEKLLIEKQLALVERKKTADEWVGLLPIIVDQMPKTLWFTKIETNQSNSLIVEGKGLDYNHLLSWVDAIQQLPQVFKSHILYLQTQQVIQFGIEIQRDGELKNVSN